MTEAISVDGDTYHWPTDTEWRRLKPVQRKERALKLLAQAIRQEVRDKPLSSAINQALFLTDSALNKHPDE